MNYYEQQQQPPPQENNEEEYQEEESNDDEHNRHETSLKVVNHDAAATIHHHHHTINNTINNNTVHNITSNHQFSDNNINNINNNNNENLMMMMINSTIIDDDQSLTRNYLIELLSQASIAIKYDLLDNQYSQAKKMYLQVSTKLDQLSPFVPQQYSKILIKYSKLYSDRANHLNKLNQQEQFNNNNNNNNNSNSNNNNGKNNNISNNNNISSNNNSSNISESDTNNNITINNENNTSNISDINSNDFNQQQTLQLNQPISNSNQQSSSSSSNQQSSSSNQQQHSLSNILSNHKKIKKSVKELNSELHDYLYPPESIPNNIQQDLIIFNDKYQFMEEEIPNYSNEFDIPTKYRHRTYWLIKRLSQTMLNGGYLFPNLYISKKVWFQQGAKLFGQSHKINYCQKLSDSISEFKTDMLIHSKNGKDIKMIDFGNVIHIQDKLLNQMLILQKDLSKYINLNTQLQQQQFNQQPLIQDPNLLNLFLDDENDSDENNIENEISYNIDSSISLSSKVFGFGKSMFKTISNTIKGNAKEETSERPYIPWLIQVFNNINFIDDWITIYEDLLKEYSSTSKIREIEELKLILERFERISFILHTTLCNFVLQDLQILLERFILKSRDSLSKLFVQKNVPFL